MLQITIYNAENKRVRKRSWWLPDLKQSTVLKPFGPFPQAR